MDHALFQHIIDLNYGVDNPQRSFEVIGLVLVSMVLLLVAAKKSLPRAAKLKDVAPYFVASAVVFACVPVAHQYIKSERMAVAEPQIADFCQTVLADVETGKIKWLHQKGIDVVSKNCGGWYALQQAANSKDSQLALSSNL